MDPQERRSFMYLDFISWLESRIRDIPVQDVIRERYLLMIKRKLRSTTGL
jgi:hypothetical protein